VVAVLTVITGPPCGGKTTYARQYAKPGDIVIDFDLIAQALGSLATHGHSDHIAAVASEARHAAIAEAIAQHRKGRRVWIVDTDPGERRRKQYAIAGARTVTCTAPPAELHRRASENRPPAWHNRIDQWLASQGQHDPQPRPHTRW
jgi:predicted kinase